MKFPSRRSTVYSTKGMVALLQPLANAAGLEILDLGGNCVDAAIAALAALCVTEPSSTGIGGDCFAIFYKDGEIMGLNGTGRAAKDIDIDYVKSKLGADAKRIPYESVFAVTVPGAIAGWYDAYESWGSGKVTFEQILAPAIRLARDGFVVHEIAANLWQREVGKLQRQNEPNAPNPFLIDGKAPREGDLVYNEEVAVTLEKIAKHGKLAFYTGEIAEAIVNAVQAKGHKLTLEDLANHKSTFVDPVGLDFKGKKVWEIPPNGHGLVAQLALGVIQELQRQGKINMHNMEHNSAEYLHVLIEACKLAFHDSEEYVCDMEFHKIPVTALLSPEYLGRRAEMLSASQPGSDYTFGVPDPKYKSDTVYLSVADKDGNACSFINSVFEGFGTGIVVGNKGFCLHNRGAGFNLTKGAPNHLEGLKRPYHTIIPGLITNDDGSLYALFGNMGGFAQPVCHVQHVMNMLVFGMTPQQLIDLPRFVLESDYDAKTDRGRGSHGPIHTTGTVVALEEGIPEETIKQLQEMGHKTINPQGYNRSLFGRAQIITKTKTKDGRFVYAGGLDLRADGAVVAQV